MKTLILASLFLFLGCGRGRSFSEIESLGTEDEYSVLKEYIKDIQLRFDKFEVDVDLSDFKYKISGNLKIDGESTVGACFKGSGITIDKRLFNVRPVNGSIKYNWRLWTTLLHEIGHCFFELKHYSNRISVPDGKAFTYYEYTFVENEHYNFYARDISSFIDSSIMTEKEVYFEVPDYNSEKKESDRLDIYVLDILGFLRDGNAAEVIAAKTSIELITLEEIFSTHSFDICADRRAKCTMRGSKSNPDHYTNWFRSSSYENVVLLRRAPN